MPSDCMDVDFVSELMSGLLSERGLKSANSIEIEIEVALAEQRVGSGCLTDRWLGAESDGADGD